MKANEPERYRALLDANNERNKKRRARIRADPDLHAAERAKLAERARLRRAQIKADPELREKHVQRVRDRFYVDAYGITLEEYESLSAAQGDLCAICLRPQPEWSRMQRLAVDHCHETGKVRGLLCDRCNRGIGLLGHHEERLRRAADYVTGTLAAM